MVRNQGRKGISAGEGKTILILEDDEIMRTLTRKMPEEQACAWIEAFDGKVALEKPASSGQAADLPLADVVMRCMSRTYLMLMNLNPGMKIVCMSGHTELLGEQGGLTTLLEKSFTRSGLSGHDQRGAD